MTLLSRLSRGDGGLFFEARRRGGQFILSWPQAGEAVLSVDGKNSSFDPRRTAPLLSRRIIRRMVEAYADSLRGRESLHATALERGGRSIAFLGESGEGKSTLASFLIEEYPSIHLVVDDVLHLRPAGALLRVVRPPHAPRLKLSSTASRPFRDRLLRAAYDPHMEKHVYSFPRAPSGALPVLSAFVQLKRGGRRLLLRRLSGSRAALTLMGHVYNEILRPPKVMRSQFVFCAEAARRVPVYSLSFPTGFRHFPRVSSLLEPLWG
jgi:hypothetical protein